MLLERDCPARTISISQEAFIDSLPTRFNPTDATTVATPLTPGTHLSADCPSSKDEIEEVADRPYRELVGALAWLTLVTRPDIAFATSSLVLGTTRSRPLGRGQTSITLPQGRQTAASQAGKQVPEVAVFTDADWGSHRDDRRSIGAYTIRIGDGVVSWRSVAGLARLSLLFSH